MCVLSLFAFFEGNDVGTQVGAAKNTNNSLSKRRAVVKQKKLVDEVKYCCAVLFLKLDPWRLFVITAFVLWFDGLCCTH